MTLSERDIFIISRCITHRRAVEKYADISVPQSFDEIYTQAHIRANSHFDEQQPISSNESWSELKELCMICLLFAEWHKTEDLAADIPKYIDIAQKFVAVFGWDNDDIWGEIEYYDVLGAVLSVHF